MGTEMALWLSAFRGGRPLLPKTISGTHFCHRLSQPQGHSAAGRIRQIEEKPSELIEIRNRNLTACSVVSQPTTLPLAPTFVREDNFIILYFFTFLGVG
jgi:hypothetical protein